MGGVRTIFHYADEGLVGEYDASGAVIKTYGYQPGGTWTTDPLFMKEGDNYYFYHNDHLGTPVVMTDSSGAVVWAAQYNSFGKAVVDMTATVTNNLRFPGQYYDEETGLHYNWNRYYDPSTGRYNRTDPIKQFSCLNNNYSYVYGNPTGYIDPLGLFSCLPNGKVDPRGTPSSPSEGAAAWAQQQYEQGNKDYAYGADNPNAGGKNQWKCNSFVRDALTKGGGLKGAQLPKHYNDGKKTPYFATANEIADPNKNTDVLGTGDGSKGDLVAWGSDSGMGHTGIVGCDGKIYNATKDGISRWNNGTWSSWNQIIRYETTGRKKVYRKIVIK